MKNIKKIAALITVIAVLGGAGAVYAATWQSPAEIAAGLTGETVEDLYEERGEGKTFGEIANDAGKLQEFKEQMLEQKKAVLDQRVQEGDLDEAQADEIYSTMENNQADCDGTGNGPGIGRENCAGFGQGSGEGRGLGAGKGQGAGNGYGAGNGQGEGNGYGAGNGQGAGHGMGFGRGIDR